MNKYDVIIIGAGPGGMFSAYELNKLDSSLKIGVFEKGNSLENRKCPIDGEKIKSCINCKTCNITSGAFGAGGMSDGKFNITNDFGGTLYEYIGKEKSIELQKYVDKINCSFGGDKASLYRTSVPDIKKRCLENNLHLLDASVRHLGTDINYEIGEKMFSFLKDKIDFHFNTEVNKIKKLENGYKIYTTSKTGDEKYECEKCIVSAGRSGSKWVEKLCESLDIETKSNRIDLGVRVELPAQVFEHLTNDLYEAKMLYKTTKYEDIVRTFCMNPYGYVVNENINGIITVNGHSYEGKEYHTDNTNFALLISKEFTEPFKDSTNYGESIAKLSNMLGGGVIVQRLGDLMKGQRSTVDRIKKNFVVPTLKATPGDLNLVIPKRIMDDIIEMLNVLDKVAPGTANPDTLLYGVEVKFYNVKVKVNNNLETKHKGLFMIGDGSGITHSLSHAAASGVYVARHITNFLA